MNNESQTWTGLLIKQRLFIGSKSEGDYWVLLADDGLWYRLADPKAFLPEALKQSFEGKSIRLFAKLDLMRGHRRLVVTSDSLEQECQSDYLISPSSPED
jgi:hypothetical protein